MNYKMTKPCNLCPFRRDAKALTVAPSTTIAFARQMLSSQGAEFVCHKTAKLVEDDETGSSIFVDAGETSSHCAGALIFAEKNGNATQMMRIVERLGMYDASKLECQDTVFDTIEEMVEASRKKFDPPSKKPKKAKKTRRKR